ncbi:MAG: 6-bladed beta-propeller [Balneolaceae bacterium]
MMKVQLIIILLLSIITNKCTNYDDPGLKFDNLKNITIYSDNAEPSSKIELVQDLNYNDSNDEIIGSFSSVAVDNKGRVFIADTDQIKIHIYNPDGSFHKSVGRRGSGPGEFNFPPQLSIKNDKLYAYDVLQMRMNIFSLKSLSLINSLNLNSLLYNYHEVLPSIMPRKIYVKNDESYLAIFDQTKYVDPHHHRYNLEETLYSEYYAIDRQGELIPKTILRKRQRNLLHATINGRVTSTGKPFPFLPKSIMTISDENYIFTSWSKNFLIKAHDLDGNYMYSFYYEIKNKYLDLNEILNNHDISDYNKRIVEHAELPTTWPALNSMIADDEGRLWVSTFTQEIDELEWWVLKNDGELIAKFIWPQNGSIEVIKDGYVYAQILNEMDLQILMRFRIKEVNI